MIKFKKLFLKICFWLLKEQIKNIQKKMFINFTTDLPRNSFLFANQNKKDKNSLKKKIRYLMKILILDIFYLKIDLP